MKVLAMRLYLICIFLFGQYFLTFSSETFETCSNKQVVNSEDGSIVDVDIAIVADSLFSAGKFFEAAIEFERLLYNATSFKDKNHYRFQKAICYKALGDYTKAKDELRRVSPVGMQKTESQTILYEKALVSYLDEDYKSCTRALLLIDMEIFNSETQKNLYIIATLNNIMLKDFEKSEEYALKYAAIAIPENELANAIKQIHEYYSRKQLPKIKNDKVFEWISIVPGFGQLYVGEIGEGFTNIGLNLAVFSFGVFQVINGFYFTGYFVSTLSINKFYFGGRTRAKNAFKEVNNKRLAEYNMAIKEHLLSISK
ncbi:MAG: hypothetical protein PF517_15955 [Salinivirgaceae bacterium]|jgi:tetratricopeptide (TPR) repeat protein|nr:hypothetical protein [Salinivirgaceae bacterium]